MFNISIGALHSGVAMVLFFAVASAQDQIPTFNLKNKSVGSDWRGRDIFVVIHAKEDTTPKLTRIKRGNSIIGEGLHIPSQPIALARGDDLSYYDLRNIDGVDVFYLRDEYGKEEKRVWIEPVTFNNVTNSTTFYVKYRYADTMRDTLGSFDAQEGARDKAAGIRKTTDGYSLANNIKDKHIDVYLEAPAGTTMKTSRGTKVYPTVDLKAGNDNAMKLIKAKK